MFALRVIAFLTLLLAMGNASAQRWILYESEEDAFRMMAPGEFEIDVIDFESEYGIIVPARVYSYEDDTGNYTVTVVDYRDSQRLHNERIEELDGVYISVYGEVDVRASIAFAAKKIRDRAESVEYDAYHYIAKVDGHQLQTTNPDGTRTFAAIYLHRSKLYVIDATVNPGSPRGGMFQQSFEFVGDDGNRIWYNQFRDAYKVLPPSGEAPPAPTRPD
ncbi:MAG TPA: hypothetical protein VIV14_12210 [Gammaproteobacteria bacterium]